MDELALEHISSNDSKPLDVVLNTDISGLVGTHRIKDWETNDRAVTSLYPEFKLTTCQSRHLLANLIRMRYFSIFFYTNGSRYATIEECYNHMFGGMASTSKRHKIR